MTLGAVLDRIDGDQPDALERLFALLRLESVSTDPAHDRQVRAAADWLVADLRGIGLDAHRRDTPGHPMVVAHGGTGGPHLLFYRTAEVNGIWGGYTGAGFKTVLPAEAHAKVSFRLVGEQDPDAVVRSFGAHVRACLPPDCEASFIRKGGSPAMIMPVDAPEFAKARAALSAEWPKPAIFVGAGGSIPVVGHFQTVLGMNAILIGFGQPDDAIHSPNEKYDLASFHKGARSWARVLAALTGAT